MERVATPPKRQGLAVALGVMVMSWVAALVCIVMALGAYLHDFDDFESTSSTLFNVIGTGFLVSAGLLVLASGVVPYLLSRRRWLLLGPVGFFAAYALMVVALNLLD